MVDSEADHMTALFDCIKSQNLTASDFENLLNKHSGIKEELFNYMRFENSFLRSRAAGGDISMQLKEPILSRFFNNFKSFLTTKYSDS